jgi:type I restriction enzyme S subunit
MIDCLGRVASVSMGQSPDSKYYSDEEIGLPFLQGCAEFQARTPKPVLFCSNAKRIASSGSVLLSVRAPVGKTNIADRDYVIGRGLAAIFATEIDQNYLAHYLAYSESEFRNVSQGSTFEAINATELKGWPVEFPVSRFEQIKIADILSTVDLAIEQTEALIAKQQRIKTGLMQDLLTRGIDEHGNLRSEPTHQFKDSPVGRIPVEWEVVALGDAGTWSSGGTPPKSTPRFWGDEVPWVCPKDMKTFDLTDTIDSLTEVGAKYGSKLMPAGTVFIVIRGMILAHTFPVGNAIRSMAFNQDIKAVVTRPNIEGRYLAYWLSAHGHDILKIATTATHGTKRFDMDDLLAVNVAVPTLSEQSRIVRAFDELQQAIDLNNKHAKKLRSLKTALMQDLLTGQVRVTPLLDNEEVNSK